MSEGTKDLKGIKYLGNFVYESNKVPKCNFMLLVSNREINVLCMSKLKTEGQSQGYQHLLSTSLDPVPQPELLRQRMSRWLCSWSCRVS